MGSGWSGESEGQTNFGMTRLREDSRLYRLVDMHGGGELLPWLRYAALTTDYSIVDGFIDVKLREFMYNGGKGKLVSVTELVKLRNKERNERLGAFSRKKGKGKSGPNILDQFDQEGENVGDLKKALKLLDGNGKGGKNESKYREITWKLEDRGSMGETMIGICLLQATELHNQLVLRILELYPKLLNDIHISEDFYGLSPLHQAIINQDVQLTYTLLKMGADVNTRCYGSFFCADDQKDSRTDSLEHEYVELSHKTNYTGNMYFGEYPLSFAACLDQVECFNLVMMHKAKINAKDTNGNTVLHMCVIHENMMFDEILELEGDSVWAYGDASSTTYPLASIDTINQQTGEMNDSSALSLVVYGTSVEHLELLDGLLDTLLDAKWESFARRSMITSVIAFTMYYLCVVAAFSLRPVSFTTEMSTQGWINRFEVVFPGRYAELSQHVVLNTSNGVVLWNEQFAQCHLIQYWGNDLDMWNGEVRMVFEILVMIGNIIQIGLDARDIKRIGRKKWFDVILAFPSKVAFKITYFLILLMIPMRAMCRISPVMIIFDNFLAVATVILTTTHYLFYCRVIRFVGPFVLMVYTIIATDIRRFLMIYGIFLMGFSQAFSLVFLSCERSATMIKSGQITGSNIDLVMRKNAEAFENVIDNPLEAFVRTFIMTIGEFTILYRNLALCPSPTILWIGKIVFILFELIVSILQFNMLIAMMTRTYETIFRTQLEYKRQRAQVILMLELSLSPKDRLAHFLKYTIPTGINKQIRSLVVNKKVGINKNQNSEEATKLREEKARKQFEEKKALLKRKVKDMETKEGVQRPPTQAVSRLQRPISRYNNN